MISRFSAKVPAYSGNFGVEKMKAQKTLRRHAVVGGVLMLAAGVAAAAAPTTSTELATAISWADATSAVLVGSAAIITFKVVKQAATIVMGLIPKAK